MKPKNQFSLLPVEYVSGILCLWDEKIEIYCSLFLIWKPDETCEENLHYKIIQPHSWITNKFKWKRIYQSENLEGELALHAKQDSLLSIVFEATGTATKIV